jgi:hypothetical protein
MKKKVHHNIIAVLANETIRKKKNTQKPAFSPIFDDETKFSLNLKRRATAVSLKTPQHRKNINKLVDERVPESAHAFFSFFANCYVNEMSSLKSRDDATFLRNNYIKFLCESERNPEKN